MKELEPDRDVPKDEFIFSRHFMGMSRNHVCAVCKENSATQDCSSGILQPCWDCYTKKGYMIIKLNKFIKLLIWLGLA